MRALVLVEPASIGLAEKVAALRGIPVLMIYGDYIADDARWPSIRAKGVAFAEAVRAAGGKRRGGGFARSAASAATAT